ncbi:MAG: sulfatase-like hydrolase/transferase [Deltaproteobacteria bacterium]|nr:sulfatase-like hydrolase/transferase [Deltaproteobacteria bacterium]
MADKENRNLKKDIIQSTKSGAIAGAGYGFSVCMAHLAMGMVLIMRMGMPPLTWFSAKAILLEVPLAIIFGILASPLFLHKKGKWLHPALLTLIWIGMELFVAVDPSKPALWLLPPLAGAGFYFLFQWVWHKRPWVVLAVIAFSPAVLLATPVINYSIGGGYDVKPVEKKQDAPKGAPDVVFVVMDTVRAHNVSAYGYGRKTTPVFDTFAKEGTLFENAMAPGTWSLASHASMFTGMLPSAHNAHGETNYLEEDIPTLAQSFAEAGYETRCFTANPHITPGFGLTRGFGWTDNAWITGAGGRGFTFIYRLVDALELFTATDKGGATVAGNVENWMAQRPKDSPPAFIFVNFLEAHFPFHQLPDEFRWAYTKEPLSTLREADQLAFGAQIGRLLTQAQQAQIRQPMVDLYDGGIKYTDYLLGKVIDTWKKRGKLDDTVFVVVGDHGEHVGEHKMFGHLTSVYQEDLHVPFMFRYPDKIVANNRVAQEVSTLGIFSTLFDLVGLNVPDTVQFGSLMPAMTPMKDGDPQKPFGRPVMAERFEKSLQASRFKPGTANGEGPLLDPRGRYRVYRSKEYKLVKHFVNGKTSTHMFDLQVDPGEMTDLAQNPDAQPVVAQMEKELRSWETVLKLPGLDGKAAKGATAKSGKSGGSKNQLSDEAQEQLKALGYME